MQEQVEAVRRMQDYIEKHLCEEISFVEVARWLFIEYSNSTPAEYIRKLKLKKSALQLRDSNSKVLDVAMEFGFGSIDGYQRAFRREFGINPKEYAKRPGPLRFLRLME